MFDQYKIEKMELTFIPNQINSDATQNSSLESGTGKVPIILIATDLDGAVALPTSENTLLRYSNHKKHFMNKPFKHTWSPRVSNIVYDAPASGSIGFSVPTRSAWIDTAYPDVNHYGAVWFMDPGSTSPGNQLDSHWYCNVFVKVWVSLRLAL
jgi:hypothetical protein